MTTQIGPAQATKIPVPLEAWDNMFAPSSCLVMITTVDPDGQVNAASYGTCTRVCHDPVYISFTCNEGTDTYANVLATDEFVVNVVPFETEVLKKVVTVGLPFRPGIDELQKAGLTGIPSTVLRPPRIAECRTHFECRVAWTHAFENRLSVCGRVVAVTTDPGCMDERGYLVWDRVKPAHYCGGHYGDMFVPIYRDPTHANPRYAGTDADFRPGRDWRNAFSSPFSESPEA